MYISYCSPMCSDVQQSVECQSQDAIVQPLGDFCCAAVSSLVPRQPDQAAMPYT